METVDRLKVSTLTDSTPNFLDQRVVLRVKGLHKQFGGQTVLERVSVELHEGEVVLLRGANGSGKTTLLNILTGNLQPDAGMIELFANGMQEEFRFPRHWRQSLNPFDHFTPERVAREGVGRTWQDIRLFTTQNLLENIAVAAPNQLGENPAWAMLRRRAVQRQENRIRRTAKAMLLDLGLEGRETSSADKVSLGQSKRVAIARAVQAGARILFLDEPLAGLDAAGIAEVMHLLKQLARTENVTLVIVEHVFNIPQILDLATTVWTLEEGTITVEHPESMPAPGAAHPSASLQDWMQQVAGAKGKIRHQRLTGGAVLSTVVPSDVSGSIALAVEDLVVYRGQRLVIGEQDRDGNLRGISFNLYKGNLSILQAPNGWGKTTLMEAIAGLLPIAQGSIRLNGQPIEELPPWERVKLGLSLLQARDNTFLNLTIREALHLSRVQNVPPNLAHLLGKKISHLSGGEKQKVALTCALNKGHYFLMDEPFSALDNAEVSNSLNHLIQVKKELFFMAIPMINI